jgi:hypothetical protein
MTKLFLADILLVALTFVGGLYLHTLELYSDSLLIFIFIFYTLSKVIAYLLVPYSQFQVFITFLTTSSKGSYLSGYEIFKSSLVILLYISSLFLHPAIWIAESILVVLMRVWAKMYIKNLNKL